MDERPGSELRFRAQATLSQVAGRALRLVCPRCGESPLYGRWLRMLERCTACGLPYEREAGYFVGAIYVNYALTIAVALGAVFLLDWTIGIPLVLQLAIAVALAVALPLAAFRHARSIWLAVDFVVTRTDERAERRREGLRSADRDGRASRRSRRP